MNERSAENLNVQPVFNENVMPGGPGSKDMTKMLNLNVIQNNDDSDEDQVVESDYDDEFLKNNSFDKGDGHLHSHDLNAS
jgi:hypothetical protein